MTLRILVSLTLWLLPSSAWAQLALDPELRSEPPAGVNEPEPSVYVPFAMLVPGTVALVTGGALFGSDLGLVDMTRDGVFIGMMVSGAALVIGSGPFFAARLVKRARWRRGQAWLRCQRDGVDCRAPRPERLPSVYQPLFLFLPGAAFSISGGVLLSLARDEFRESQNSVDPGEDATPAFHYVTGAALLGIGSTLVVASAVYLAVRLTKRARFRREHRALAWQMAPLVSLDAAGRHSFGALLHTTF